MIWLVLDVLHEDEIPDLHEAVFIADGGTAALPELGPLSKKISSSVRRDRAPPSARSSPSSSSDPLGGHDPRPDLGRLVVGLEHRVPEKFGVEPEAIGDELVRPGNGVLFEVVTEAEIPQHLEEGEMTLRRADDVDVDGSDDLLDGGRPRYGGVSSPRK